MRITTEAKDTIYNFHLLTGSSFEDSRMFFESLVTIFIMNAIEEKPTTIPYIGEFNFRFVGDELIHKNKLKAQIVLDFKPDDFFLKNIGQIQDNKECDLLKFIKKRISNLFAQALDINLEKE